MIKIIHNYFCGSYSIVVLIHKFEGFVVCSAKVSASASTMKMFISFGLVLSLSLSLSCPFYFPLSSTSTNTHNSPACWIWNKISKAFPTQYLPTSQWKYIYSTYPYDYVLWTLAQEVHLIAEVFILSPILETPSYTKITQQNDVANQTSSPAVSRVVAHLKSNLLCFSPESTEYAFPTAIQSD